MQKITTIIALVFIISCAGGGGSIDEKQVQIGREGIPSIVFACYDPRYQTAWIYVEDNNRDITAFNIDLYDWSGLVGRFDLGVFGPGRAGFDLAWCLARVDLSHGRFRDRNAAHPARRDAANVRAQKQFGLINKPNCQGGD